MNAGKIGGLVLCVSAGLLFLNAALAGPSRFQDESRVISSARSGVGGHLAASMPSRRGGVRQDPSLGKRYWPSRASDRESAMAATREIGKGNLRLTRVDTDGLARMEHRRYTQFYKGLEVLGGQVIQHQGRGRASRWTGRLYEGIAIDPTPLIDAGTAAHRLRTALAGTGLDRLTDGPILLVYPVTDGHYRLAYRLGLGDGPAARVTGFVDARTGEVLKTVSEERPADLTIGLGVGAHGGLFKLPTTLANGVYWLADYQAARPVDQITRDYSTYNGSSDAVASDADNVWDHDGALVSVHAYAGWVYDYFYAVLGRAGYDGANQKDIIAHVHYPTSGIAVYSAGEMSFDTPAAAALDLVGHEYAHGVVASSSALMYYCDADAQPGVLDEAFADIIGTAVEFYWQDPGSGYDMADWLLGEDIDPPYAGNLYYGAPEYLRNLADPNATFFVYEGVSYPYPCHLSQCRVFEDPVSDWGGVHFNSTLYSHAFYLLAAGGTNRISGLEVTPIGIDEAAKIFYRAWTYYLTSRADYLDAANALLQSASDLYGPASTQRARTARALEAIGWVID